MKAARYRAHRIQRGGLGGDGAGRYWLLESGLQQGGRVRGVVPDAVPIWCCRVLLASDELFLVLWLHSRVVLRWLCQFGQFGLCQRGLARAVLSGCGAARALKLVACSGATPRNAGRPHKPGLRFARLRPHLHAPLNRTRPASGRREDGSCSDCVRSRPLRRKTLAQPGRSLSHSGREAGQTVAVQNCRPPTASWQESIIAQLPIFVSRPTGFTGKACEIGLTWGGQGSMQVSGIR